MNQLEPITFSSFLIDFRLFLDFGKNLEYTGVRPEGRPSSRTILPNSRLTGQFCFLGVRLTGQLENLDRLTVLVT